VCVCVCVCVWVGVWCVCVFVCVFVGGANITVHNSYTVDNFHTNQKDLFHSVDTHLLLNIFIFTITNYIFSFVTKP